MSPLYHERIPADVAKQVLQDEFVAGSNMSYYLVSEYSQSTIVQHNDTTGEDIEVRLEEATPLVDEEVKPILSYVGDYRETIPISVILQWVLIGLAVLTVVFCLFLFK